MTTHPLQFGKHPAPHASSAQLPAQARKLAMPIGGEVDEKQHEALTQNAQKWVAQTFYGEMLKQMRNSPFKSKLFSGGEGGDAYQQMSDSQMALKMSHGAGKKLVDSIVSKIENDKLVATGKVVHSKHAASRAYRNASSQIGAMR